MASNDKANGGEQLPTYLENDLPGLFKWFFIAIVVWGVIFALYFILTGYDSQKRFDQTKAVGVAERSLGGSASKREGLG